MRARSLAIWPNAGGLKQLQRDLFDRNDYGHRLRPCKLRRGARALLDLLEQEMRRTREIQPWSALLFVARANCTHQPTQPW